MPKTAYKSVPGDQNRNASDAEIVTNTATSATAGANGAVPAQVAGYILFELANGAVAKVPYFNA